MSTRTFSEQQVRHHPCDRWERSSLPPIPEGSGKKFSEGSAVQRCILKYSRPMAAITITAAAAPPMIRPLLFLALPMAVTVYSELCDTLDGTVISDESQVPFAETVTVEPSVE